MRLFIILGIIFPALVLAGLARAQTIADGDLVKIADGFDIYIVKIKAEKKFKRLILNPAIFNSYGHLKWENVKTVPQATLDGYKLSEFAIQVNSDGSVADPKVYKVSSAGNSDVGERRWLNVTATEFEALSYDWDSIYSINSTEASPNFYPTKDPLTYQNLLPKETPIVKAPVVELTTADTSPPSVSSIKVAKILADSASITWNTDESADSLVKYGISESSLSLSSTGMTAQKVASTFSHAVKLTRLEPNTKYYYQAVSTDSSGNTSQIITNSFTTTDCYGDVPVVHTTVQQAIDAVSVAGGRICVAAGTFSENLIINGKDVKIIGQGAGNTILTQATTSEVLVIKNAGVSTIIEKVSIQNGNPYAIRIEDSSPIIRNNYIINNSGGIRILGNSRPTIKYNVFDGNSAGAAVAHNGTSGDYTIDHNTFINNGKNGEKAAVLIDSIFSSSPINITNNIFSSGFLGVYEVSPSNFYLWNNLFYNNVSAHLKRENSFYYSATAINDLGVATKNVVSDPLLDAGYKPKANSPAVSAATDSTNIGAY